MYLVAIFIFILELDLPLSHSFPEGIFPKHTDLQKVGEVIFNNEKFNILRPTTHIISDYFKDFILRRDSQDIPSNRLFVDDNSFRHYWTGFDRKTNSLRKTEILADNFDATVKEENNDTNEEIKIEKDETAEGQVSSSSTTSNESIEKKENSGEESSPDDENSDQESTTEVNNVKVVNVSEKNINEATTGVPQLRGGETTDAPAVNRQERTIVKTTFFCPYFGVISMAAFVD